MARRRESAFPATDAGERRYSGLHFINESVDKSIYDHFVFEFCTFEKIGAKETKFNHCEFRHCEFLDSYLAHARFDHCSFTGSYFERCVFSWAEFPNSALDYTNFMDCGPVLSQIQNQKPRDPQTAAKFLRNLAIEHKKLGNWEQVDRFIVAAYKERERHFWYVIVGQNKHYKERYSASQRLGYFFRWAGYKLSGLVFGYGVSWAVFLRTIAIFGFFLFPLLNGFLGSTTKHPGFRFDNATGEDIWLYFVELYTLTIRSFFSFVPSPANMPLGLTIPFWLSSVEAIFGTAMVAVFAALLFRWASKGN